jgi:hypothetical protein
MEQVLVKKRFGEMWQQAENMTKEEDEAEAVMMFMQRYGELIVKECLWIIENHPEDAAKRIEEIYEVNRNVSIN